MRNVGLSIRKRSQPKKIGKSTIYDGFHLYHEQGHCERTEKTGRYLILNKEENGVLDKSITEKNLVTLAKGVVVISKGIEHQKHHKKTPQPSKKKMFFNKKLYEEPIDFQNHMDFFSQ
ncbi:hypothetical protein O181_018983 [Austropuccinia psidii MF-1]|uniref:Uncharacterized protein n=1 Tax=Austropuccinia psidii MF-1 TaxID=1389203 RepID=A0A9Q3C8U4_9BASI|nr:hypothetical protein [Austropuccinia psidii MF-1]